MKEPAFGFGTCETYLDQCALRQHLLDTADGLSCALFVFDEAEPQVAVVVAEGMPALAATLPPWQVANAPHSVRSFGFMTCNSAAQA